MAGNLRVVDGSLIDGGGQVLRHALAYCYLFQQPLRVEDIRSGRFNDGLQERHMVSLSALDQLGSEQKSSQIQRPSKVSKKTALIEKLFGLQKNQNERIDLSSQTLKGVTLDSSAIEFYPRPMKGGNYFIDARSSSAVFLLQTILPCLFFSPSETTLQIEGGTDLPDTPSIGYFKNVFQPMLEKYANLKFQVTLLKRGFSEGRGEIFVNIPPIRHFSPINMVNRGELVKIRISPYISPALPSHISQRMAASAKNILLKHFPQKIIQDDSVAIQENNENIDESPGFGGGILITGETSTGCILAGDSIAQKGVKSEEIGELASKNFMKSVKSGGCMDEHLQEQLILYMALAKGESKILTGHVSLSTETAIYLAEHLTSAKFKIESVSKNTRLITCLGIGIENPFLPLQSTSSTS